MANTKDLDQVFWANLQRMIAASPYKIGITSGFRTRAEQERLYRQKPHLAARPGRSNHEKGRAVDLNYFGSVEAQRWALANAHRFGLRFPMGVKVKGKKYEPWHIEPGSGGGGDGGGSHAGHSHGPGEIDDDMGGYVNESPKRGIETQLQTLSDILSGAFA